MKSRRFIIEISTVPEVDGDSDEAIGEAFFDDLCNNDYGDYLMSVDSWDPVR